MATKLKVATFSGVSLYELLKLSLCAEIASIGLTFEKADGKYLELFF